MVAEPTRITSLKRPPEGWEFDPDRSITRTAYEGLTVRNPSLPEGPRPDAEASDALPIVRLGVDPLPPCCSHCGGTFLTTEPPVGGHRYGDVTCQSCGRQAARTLAAPGSDQPAPAMLMPPELSAFVRESFEYARASSPRKITPTPGCDGRCSDVFGHDAGAHEAYGHRRALLDLAAPAEAVVRTGRLIVDTGRREILFDGQQCYLTPTGTKLLLLLAGRIGRCVPSQDLTLAIWAADDASARHTLRVQVSRLRDALGGAAGLVVTMPGMGYRLEAIPPVGDVPDPWPPYGPPGAPVAGDTRRAAAAGGGAS